MEIVFDIKANQQFGLTDSFSQSFRELDIGKVTEFRLAFILLY
jgi:hypothetical protein